MREKRDYKLQYSYPTTEYDPQFKSFQGKEINEESEKIKE